MPLPRPPVTASVDGTTGFLHGSWYPWRGHGKKVIEVLSFHDAGIQTDIAIVDFNKAFDTGSHRKLT